jgi:hypothetical protein
MRQIEGPLVNLLKAVAAAIPPSTKNTIDAVPTTALAVAAEPAGRRPSRLPTLFATDGLLRSQADPASHWPGQFAPLSRSSSYPVLHAASSLR